MTTTSLEALIGRLNAAGVRYMVVGGLAVNAHGYVRYTNDVDLIVAFDRENLAKALQVLKGMNYRPRAPVPIEEFADAAKRKEWQEGKGLKAFALTSSEHKETEVDLFIDDPLGFEEAVQRAMLYQLTEDLEMPVCGLSDLVKLKRQANRDKDRTDLENLAKLFPDGL